MERSRIITMEVRKVAPKALWANVLLLIGFAAAFHFLAEPLDFSFSIPGILYFIIGYVVLIFIHEAFHLIGFILFAKVPFSSLDVGLNLDMGVAYATTTEPIPVKAMKNALLLPFWMTAAIPGLIGFWLGDQVLVLLAAMLAAGAYGDFYMYKALLKEPKSAWVLDDPELPRLHIFDEKPHSKSPDA